MLFEINDELRKIIEGLDDMALKVGGRQNLDSVNKVEEMLKNPAKEINIQGNKQQETKSNFKDDKNEK